MMLPDRPLIAVLDIGKTNAKLVVAERASGAEAWSATRGNVPLADAPYRAIDAAAIEAFALEALADAPHSGEIAAIVPVAHGACAALVAGNGLALPVMDYEEPALDAVAEAYRPERDPFAATLSPFLPLGLNLGRQLFFQATRFAEGFASASAILTWPQYWAWRLCGIMACELTSIGCHTDLWLPRDGRFSALARRRGWDRLFPPLHAASDALGPITPSVAAATGLPPDTAVLCGIHDSNASYLRHRATRAAGEAFAVVSSGTWTIILAAGTDLDHLDERRDCLANVDAYGSPTATARFMGGREYQAVAGEASATPTPGALSALLATDAMALPGFAVAGGPFQGRAGRIEGAADLDPPQRAALATLYVALVTDVALDLLGSRGPIAVEGPLADNPLYAGILAALRPQSEVIVSQDRAGTIGGALILAGAEPAPAAKARAKAVPRLADPRLVEHRRRWRAAVNGV